MALGSGLRLANHGGGGSDGGTGPLTFGLTGATESTSQLADLAVAMKRSTVSRFFFLRKAKIPRMSKGIYGIWDRPIPTETAGSSTHANSLPLFYSAKGQGGWQVWPFLLAPGPETG